jgi:hypothetical protein
MLLINDDDTWKETGKMLGSLRSVYPVLRNHNGEECMVKPDYQAKQYIGCANEVIAGALAKKIGAHVPSNQFAGFSQYKDGNYCISPIVPGAKSYDEAFGDDRAFSLLSQIGSNVALDIFLCTQDRHEDNFIFSDHHKNWYTLDYVQAFNGSGFHIGDKDGAHGDEYNSDILDAIRSDPSHFFNSLDKIKRLSADEINEVIDNIPDKYTSGFKKEMSEFLAHRKNMIKDISHDWYRTFIGDIPENHLSLQTLSSVRKNTSHEVPSEETYKFSGIKSPPEGPSMQR